MTERVVVVEDDRELRDLLVDMLTGAGFEPVPFASGTDASRALTRGDECDLVITDLVMPGLQGDELLQLIRGQRPELNVIIITAFGSIDSAIQLIKAGAYDYVTKPFSTDELILAVQRGLAESRLRRELINVRRAGTVIPGFVGNSRQCQDVVAMVIRAGKARHPVLLTGESGTGKELIARAIHTISGRESFVPVNCSALPDHLIESELFGHERGAFTGANRAKEGLFEAAHEGTAFLDEIAELPLALQPKLLRALEDGEIRRVGSIRPRPLDVRLIAATNRNLDEETAEGRFRDDLYWRINVLAIHLPPLRERASDIPLLAEHFLKATVTDSDSGPKRFEPDAMTLLAAYPWPGNVRELRNVIQRIAVLTDHDHVRAEDLPERIRDSQWSPGVVAGASGRQMSLRQLERAYVLEVLRRADGNKTRAAEILGLDRKTLYRKLEEYGETEPGDPSE